MSFFDHYLPEPSLRCPACNAPLVDWQGTDGPNGLFVWKQGGRPPVDQLADGEGRLDDNARAALHLPNAFRMYTACCSKRFFVEAIGRAPNGIWSSTELITVNNAQRDKDERMEDFKARLRWLQGGRH